MTRADHGRPPAAELDILNVLWEQGPSTVREVQEALPPDRSRGYTTVLKLLQIMHEKGLAARRKTGKAHVYRARVTQRQTQRRITTELLDSLFGGSAGRLAVHALSDRKASPEELEEIRKLLDELEDEE